MQKLILTTTDDAIGECFDKVARVLKLSYPGGPNVEKLASNATGRVSFNYKENKNKDSFSYSGLKTAVINYVNNNKDYNAADVARTFQTLAVNQLTSKVIKIVEQSKNKTLVICGGVSANKYLQNQFKEQCIKSNIKLIVPPLNLCTDNAAMIASEGYFKLVNSKNFAGLDLVAVSNLPL